MSPKIVPARAPWQRAFANRVDNFVMYSGVALGVVGMLLKARSTASRILEYSPSSYSAALRFEEYVPLRGLLFSAC